MYEGVKVVFELIVYFEDDIVMGDLGYLIFWLNKVVNKDVI